MKPFLFILGTRPEAIKLLPLVWEFQKRDLPFEILHTDQHTELLDTMFAHHAIVPNYRLSIGKQSDLAQTKIEMLSQMRDILTPQKFSSVIVQGDTLSTLVGAEYGFFHAIPVIHIEAGMRTYCNEDPYPEEAFRRMISTVATLHFCPSEDEARNLRREGIPHTQIFTVGNTFADYWNTISKPNVTPKKQILITLHRRENLSYIDRIFDALAELSKELNEYHFLFPLHPNPAIVSCAEAHLRGVSNFCLTAPMKPDEFYRELLRSEMIVTDSGGVQEECIFHAKKILILRKVSERRSNFPFSILVDPEDPFLKNKFYTLLKQPNKESHSDYYGRGDSAKKIADILLKQKA
ncbi:MAG: UDP-N-acetylglucosamine 2-epimerase (non-hydrolyzing) [Clostridia bacterium]|nr:UDP-N-acetylglucosamine 2-epimerase (non-hydrolyzing) [Clostridia bacterium]